MSLLLLVRQRKPSAYPFVLLKEPMTLVGFLLWTKPMPVRCFISMGPIFPRRGTNLRSWRLQRLSGLMCWVHRRLAITPVLLQWDWESSLDLECSLPNVLRPHSFHFLTVQFCGKWGLWEMCTRQSNRNGYSRKLASESLQSVSGRYSCTIIMAIWSRKNLAFSKTETKWLCSNIWVKSTGNMALPYIWVCPPVGCGQCSLHVLAFYRIGQGSAGGAKTWPESNSAPSPCSPTQEAPYLLLLTCLHCRCLPNKAFAAVVSPFMRLTFLSPVTFSLGLEEAPQTVFSVSLFLKLSPGSTFPLNFWSFKEDALYNILYIVYFWSHRIVLGISSLASLQTQLERKCHCLVK